MGTLYIDRKDAHIRLDGNAIAFYIKGESEGMVPINPLKRVVIMGNIIIDTSVLHRLADNDISVLLLSGKRGRFCGMLHGRLHNNGILRVRQYEKSLDNGDVSGMSFPLRFSLDTVLRKIKAQADLLREAMDSRADLRFPLKTASDTLDKVIDRINSLSKSEDVSEKTAVCHPELVSGFVALPGEEIPKQPRDETEGVQDYRTGMQNGVDRGADSSQEVRLDNLRGYEGGASASYFSAYTKLFPASLNFTKRTRRPPEDPVNALLSLCYTLLHYEIVREVEVIGLDPTIGFYHQFEYGRESLACDLVEVFRPEVDRFVWKIFRERIFAGRDFSCEDERPGCYLKKNSRSRFYPLYEEWAQAMRPRFTEEVRDLARNIMDGEDVFQNGQDTLSE